MIKTVKKGLIYLEALLKNLKHTSENLILNLVTGNSTKTWEGSRALIL